MEPSTTTMPQGGVVRQVQADGSTQFVLPDATVVTITVDATTLAENVTASDDCPVTLLADGTRGLTHADGLTARDGGVAGPGAYRDRHEDADGATRWTPVRRDLGAGAGDRGHRWHRHGSADGASPG